jgi:excisionase family DNA binding protein
MAQNGGRDTSTAPELQEDPDMTVTTSANAERLLTPGEVAALFRVDPKTVTRWASAGRIGSIRTPGGHRRLPASEGRQMLADHTSEATGARIH